MPPPEESSFSSCTSNTDTYFHKRLDHCRTETSVPLKLTILPPAERNRSAIGMASSLLIFLVWFGSANIAARHSSIRRIGSKAKSPASSSWTSSFVTAVTCKRGNSDCVPRKSVFGIDPPHQEKNRHCGNEQQSDRNRDAKGSEGHVK